MKDGFLLVDKPDGPTSHDIVTAVRRRLGVRRVGHAGTLDPFATGLLIVMVGRATRLARFVASLDKQYAGVVRLGVGTDTDDRTGAVIARDDAWRLLTDDAIHTAMAGFVGTGPQRPPAFSAKKIDGRRAYRIARGGADPELRDAAVTIHDFTMEDRRDDRVWFRARVSSGTYVRAAARDLGVALGCPAHLDELRRTAIGSFDVADAVELAQVGWDDLQAPLALVSHLAHVEVDQETAESVRHGRAVSAGTHSGPVAIVAGGGLVAVAEPVGEMMAPRVVLA